MWECRWYACLCFFQIHLQKHVFTSIVSVWLTYRHLRNLLPTIHSSFQFVGLTLFAVGPLGKIIHFSPKSLWQSANVVEVSVSIFFWSKNIDRCTSTLFLQSYAGLGGHGSKENPRVLVGGRLVYIFFFFFLCLSILSSYAMGSICQERRTRQPQTHWLILFPFYIFLWASEGIYAVKFTLGAVFVFAKDSLRLKTRCPTSGMCNCYGNELWSTATYTVCNPDSGA